MTNFVNWLKTIVGSSYSILTYVLRCIKTYLRIHLKTTFVNFGPGLVNLRWLPGMMASMHWRQRDFRKYIINTGLVDFMDVPVDKVFGHFWYFTVWIMNTFTVFSHCVVISLQVVNMLSKRTLFVPFYGISNVM